MLVEPLLSRLVVIGRHDQRGVGAGALGVASEFDRLDRVVRSRARDDGHPATRLVDADVHDPAMFLVRQRRAFARRAHGHQSVRARRNLPVYQSAEGLLVEFAVLERSDQGRHRAVKLRPLFHLALPLVSRHAAPGASEKTHKPSIAPAKGARRPVAWLTLPKRSGATVMAGISP